MNPQKELQQIQDLSLKLGIPIWENTIEITFRDKKKYHTFALEKKNLLLGLKKMSLKKMGLKTIKKLLFLYPLKQT